MRERERDANNKETPCILTQLKKVLSKTLLHGNTHLLADTSGASERHKIDTMIFSHELAVCMHAFVRGIEHMNIIAHFQWLFFVSS